MRTVRGAAAALVLAVAALWVAAAPPAAAIETAEFGLAPAPTQAHREKLEVEARPGSTSTDGVRVWNKTKQPIALRLSVVPARLARDGSAVLGGDGTAASWVELERADVRLSPGESRVVGFEVRVPARLEPGRRTFAVMAEPALADAAAPAVLARVAVMGYLTPKAGAPLTARVPGGLLPWVALALLTGVAVFTARRAGGGVRLTPSFTG